MLFGNPSKPTTTTTSNKKEKLVVIPYTLFKFLKEAQLIKASNQNLNEESELNNAEEELLKARRTRPKWERNTIVQQKLRNYLRARGRAVNKPIRVTLSNGARAVIGPRPGGVSGVNVLPKYSTEKETPEQIAIAPDDEEQVEKLFEDLSNPEEEHTANQSLFSLLSSIEDRTSNASPTSPSSSFSPQESPSTSGSRIGSMVSKKFASAAGSAGEWLLNKLIPQATSSPLSEPPGTSYLKTALFSDPITAKILESIGIKQYGSGRRKAKKKTVLMGENFNNKNANEETVRKKIEKLYTDPESPGSYAGARSLWFSVKKEHPEISFAQIQNYLSGNRTYSLFRQRRHHFPRLKTIPTGFLSDVQVDLGDFQKIADKNDGNKYLLLGVDVLSSRFFGVPSLSKSPKHMMEAFDNLFRQMPFLPKRVYSDQGLEFESGSMKNYFDEKGIEKLRTSTGSRVKAAVAERGLRTIKGRLYKWFSDNNREDWVTVLPKFLDAINNTINRATGLTPNNINEQNAHSLWLRMYRPLIRQSTRNKSKILPPEQMVRVGEPREVFDKGYHSQFSDHLYTVERPHSTHPETYELKNYYGEPIRRKFYRPELVPIPKESDLSFRVEKTIRQRKNRRTGEQEFLVKFIGYKNLEWIKAKDFI